MSIQAAIDILRKATRLVKVAPFFFAIVFLLCMLGYLLGSETISSLLDILFYTSPLVVVFILQLSKIFKMCIWHRIECLLPLLPLLSVMIDEFIINLDSVGSLLNYIIVVFVFVISLVNGYLVFFKHKPDEKIGS